MPLLAAAAIPLAFDDEPTEIPPYVTSGESVYLLMPPQPIVGDAATSVSWSPTGRFVLVRRSSRDTAQDLKNLTGGRPVTGHVESSYVIYDLAKQKSSVIWKSDDPSVRVEQSAWLVGSDRLAFTVTEPLRTVDPTRPKPTRETMYLTDAAAGQTSVVVRQDQIGGSPFIAFDASPMTDVAVVSVGEVDRNAATAAPTSGTVVEASRSTPTYRHYLLRSDGSLSSQLKVEADAFLSDWRADDGSPVFASYYRNDQGRFSVKASVVDLKTGRIESVEKVQGWRKQERNQPIFVQVGASKGTRGPVAAELASLGDGSKALIAADASSAVLAPDLSAIAYISDGVALVRPVLQLPKSAFLQAVVVAERERAVKNAKQAGLAMSMYGQDYDETLPGQGFDMRDILSPYMKNPKALGDLVYTFSGGMYKDQKDPAGTELGYIPGPGGKAMIYLDGHVVWIPDP